MSELNPAEFASKITNFLKSIGATFHEEDNKGESITRIQVEKKLSDNPKAIPQSIGVYLNLNLPGDTDKTVVGAIDMITAGGTGNSSESPSSPG